MLPFAVRRALSAGPDHKHNGTASARQKGACSAAVSAPHVTFRQLPNA